MGIKVRAPEVSGTEPRSENGWCEEREYRHTARVSPPELYFTQYRPARNSWEEKMEKKRY